MSDADDIMSEEEYQSAIRTLQKKRPSWGIEMVPQGELPRSIKQIRDEAIQEHRDGKTEPFDL